MHLTQDYRQLITYFFPPYISHVRMAPSSQGKIRGKEQRLQKPTDLNQASGQEGQIGYPRLIKGEAKCYLELWEAINPSKSAMPIWGDYGGIKWLMACLDRERT